MIIFRNILHISKKYRTFIKSGAYEPHLLRLLNASTEIFPNYNFKRFEDQSHGEPDFYDRFQNVYDAKLLIDTEQGKMIGESEDNLDNWINSVTKELTEFGSCIKDRDNYYENLENTKLYRVMRDRLSSVTCEENAILFMPYPIGIEVEGLYFFYGVTDCVRAIYRRLEVNKYVKCKHVYFIYPGQEGKFIIRDASDNKREFIADKELSEIISCTREYIGVNE